MEAQEWIPGILCDRSTSNALWYLQNVSSTPFIVLFHTFKNCCKHSTDIIDENNTHLHVSWRQRYDLQTMCHRSLLFRRLKFLIQRQSPQLYQVRFRYFLSVAVTEFHFEFFYIAAFLAITVILLDDCLMKRDISEGLDTELYKLA